MNAYGASGKRSQAGNDPKHLMCRLCLKVIETGLNCICCACCWTGIALRNVRVWRKRETILSGKRSQASALVLREWSLCQAFAELLVELLVDTHERKRETIPSIYTCAFV